MECFGNFCAMRTARPPIEYSLIAGFIALAIIAAVGMTGPKARCTVRESHTCVDPALTRQVTIED
jgi:hypothetical protein